MANTKVQVRTLPGQYLTLILFAPGGQSIANGSGDSLSPIGEGGRLYEATVTEPLQGLYHATLLASGVDFVTGLFVELANDTGPYTIRSLEDDDLITASQIREAVGLSAADLDDKFAALVAPGGLSQVELREALGLSSANLDARLASILEALENSSSAAPAEGSLNPATPDPVRPVFTPSLPASSHARYTLQAFNTDGDLLVGAQVWVTTDSEGLFPVTGPMTSDAQGQVYPYLEKGKSFYKWVLQSGQLTLRNEPFSVPA